VKLLDRILHLAIFAQNCFLLYDAFFRQTISWARLGFIFASILLLLWLWRMQAKNTHQAMPQVSAPAISTSKLLDDQRREIAKLRLGKLFERGTYLSKNYPHNGDSSMEFTHFWAKDVEQWKADTAELLLATWGKLDADAFLSLAGEPQHQFAIGVHPSCAPIFRDLLRHIRNLDSLRTKLAA